MRPHSDNLDFTPPPSDPWGGPLTLALLVHAALGVALAWGVQWKKDTPVTFEAELWSRLPQAASPAPTRTPPPPPAPEPASEPQPPAPPPPAVPTAAPVPAADIAERRAEAREKALREQREAQARQAVEAAAEAEARRQRELKAQQDKARQTAEAEARRQRDLKAQQDKARQEQQARENARREREQQAREDAERERLRQENLQRMLGQAGTGSSTSGAGRASQASGPAGYAARVSARIRPNVVFTDTVPGNPLAEVEVRLTPQGQILSARLTRSSGHPAWDQAALRAVERTGTLPADVDGRVPPTMLLGLRPREGGG